MFKQGGSVGHAIFAIVGDHCFSSAGDAGVYNRHSTGCV
jgi:hypothetical protein